MIKMHHSFGEAKIEKLLTIPSGFFHPLIILLLADSIFLFIHILSSSNIGLIPDNGFTRLDNDGGFAELFQYAKFLAVTACLVGMFFHFPRMLFLLWASFFFWLCIDDSFSIHEKYGLLLSDHLKLPDGFVLEPKDLGELIISGSAGFLFLLPMIFSWLHAGRIEKRIIADFVILTGVLVFFGGVNDTLHAVLKDVPGSGLLTIMEDGGEMVALSFICWYSIVLFSGRKKAFTSPIDFLLLRVINTMNLHNRTRFLKFLSK